VPHKQLDLPFEGEVLVVLHKGELHQAVAGRGAIHSETQRLIWRALHTARVLGFTVRAWDTHREQRGDWLHIQLRAEAERT
jgi:hypothetical protein